VSSKDVETARRVLLAVLENLRKIDR